MNITEMLGAPVSDPADPIPAVTQGCSMSPPPPEPDAETRRARPRAWLWLVTILTALAGGYGLATWIRPVTAEPPPTVPAELRSAAASPAVTAVAEMVTALHLTGLAGPEDLAILAAGTIPTTGPTGFWVNSTAAIATEPHADAQWLVTVAVDVLELVDGAYEPAGIQFFEILVADGASPTAISLPSRVPPPPTGLQPAAASFGAPVPIDQEHAISGFLGAYLTGNGEVARYAATTARMPRFPEPPYESVSVQQLGADSQGAVRARVAATTRRGTALTLDYTLELTFERGVWEITAINRLPARY